MITWDAVKTYLASPYAIPAYMILGQWVGLELSWYRRRKREEKEEKEGKGEST